MHAQPCLECKASTAECCGHCWTHEFVGGDQVRTAEPDRRLR